MKDRDLSSTIALSFLAAIAFIGSANAALVATGVNNANDINYVGVITTDDLLLGLTPTTSGSWTFDTNANVLNDEVAVSGGNNTSSGNAYLSVDGGATFTFDLTGSVTGYDITSIISYAGWTANAHNHAVQNYQVLISLVGSVDYNPLNFTAGNAAVSNNISYDPFAGGEGSTRVTLTDDVDSVIASGVDGIRFILTNGATGLTDNTVYQEIEVFGTATIPEPSSALLCGLGLLALLHRRR